MPDCHCLLALSSLIQTTAHAIGERFWAKDPRAFLFKDYKQNVMVVINTGLNKNRIIRCVHDFR